MTKDQSTRSLFCAIVLQAMRDLGDDNEIVAYDAYLWLLSDGPLYMDALDINVDIRRWTTEKWEVRQAKGAREARRSMIQTFSDARLFARETA